MNNSFHRKEEEKKNQFLFSVWQNLNMITNEKEEKNLQKPNSAFYFSIKCILTHTKTNNPINEIRWKKKHTHTQHLLFALTMKRKDEEKKKRITFTSIYAISTYSLNSSLFYFRLVQLPVSYELPIASKQYILFLLFFLWPNFQNYLTIDAILRAIFLIVFLLH